MYLKLGDRLLGNDFRGGIALAVVAGGPTVRKIEGHLLSILGLHRSHFQLSMTADLHNIGAVLGELLLEFSSHFGGCLLSFSNRSRREESSGNNKHCLFDGLYGRNEKQGMNGVGFLA